MPSASCVHNPETESLHAALSGLQKRKKCFSLFNRYFGIPLSRELRHSVPERRTASGLVASEEMVLIVQSSCYATAADA